MSVTTSATVVPTGTWGVDPAHSNVGFAVKHMGIATVRGEFTEFEGTLEIGEDLSTPRSTAPSRRASVDTNEPQRDAHLRSADFFDVDQYPELPFESTRIEPLDDEEFRITGRLTLHGVTNESCSTPRSRAPTPTPGATSASASRSPASSPAATTG